MAKVDGLIGKANAIGSALEALRSKKSKLQEKIEGIDQKVTSAKDLYAAKTGIIDLLK